MSALPHELDGVTPRLWTERRANGLDIPRPDRREDDKHAHERDPE